MAGSVIGVDDRSLQQKRVGAAWGLLSRVLPTNTCGEGQCSRSLDVRTGGKIILVVVLLTGPVLSFFFVKS